MSAYEIILSIEKPLLERMASIGLLRSTVIRDVKIYEHYLNERKTSGCMQSRTNTAEHFNLSEESISKIIQKMK